MTSAELDAALAAQGRILGGFGSLGCPEQVSVEVVEPGGKVLETVCRSEREERAEWDSLREDADMLSALLNEMRGTSGSMDTARKLAASVKERIGRLKP